VAALACGCLALALLLGPPGVEEAKAKIYKFVNRRGQVVYTNSLARVPSSLQNGLTTWQPRIHRPRPRSRTPRLVNITALVNRYAATHGLDPDLLRAMIKVESGFNPRAVSPKGAMGLMQIMPQTAREMGLRRPFDADSNVEAGARYLKQLLAKYDDLNLALAAYNAGPAAVDRYGGIPPYQETQAYVVAVNRHFRQFKRQARGR